MSESPNEISVSVILVGMNDATPDHAKRAIEYLLAHAERYPPDRRFDWGNCFVQASKGK